MPDRLRQKASEIIKSSLEVPKHKRGYFVKCCVEEHAVPDRWILKAHMEKLRREKRRK